MFQDIKVPDTPIDDVITNDGFWPDVSVSAFQRECRIPPEYSMEQQRNMLIASMAGIGIELYAFRERCFNDGYTQLSDVGMKIDGKSVHVASYYQAVFQRAKATLLVHFATLERRDEAASIAKESRDTHTALMSLSQMAVRNILGRTIATVKLL
ncbi:head completion/stabilization protein [Shewanella sp. D64]|uniref:head completion/stabilization protein n=1 Tax=unclassified Shewanella TaxID=196818 RepID=UPI0022BA4D2C|nr:MULTISPECIES: head completion/stabilization protein [unclassified Shewanella]MEC4728840.1 head completion/stabilization protein [Shewanella sp. D64]MEC4740714.1 head completion/stabilization protein [Shewanella sp. E94]WBJ95327.1 head completion/stabilization protein [Shewanella sp. MTB7]